MDSPSLLGRNINWLVLAVQFAPIEAGRGAGRVLTIDAVAMYHLAATGTAVDGE
jgi:hypothetical protein